MRKAEIRQILPTLDLSHPLGRRNRLLLLFLLQTGIQPSECVRLTIHQVAFGDHPRGSLRLPVRKGSRSSVILLGPEMQDLIRKILAFNSTHGFSTSPNAPLFQDFRREPISVRSITSYRQKTASSRPARS